MSNVLKFWIKNNSDSIIWIWHVFIFVWSLCQGSDLNSILLI